MTTFMARFMVRCLPFIPCLLPIGLFAAPVAAQSLDQPNSLDGGGFSLDEDNLRLSQPLTSVSRFSDVQPTDWAFEALRSLVERYGCVAGYPDGTFRGNRAMTRYEFAAGLNACLDQIVALIEDPDDLDQIRRLLDEFSAELAVLEANVNSLESRVAELETNQFSTTTKLTGEVILAASTAFVSDIETLTGRVIDNDDVTTVAQARARLNFNTSFSGEDLLITRIEAGDVPPLLRSNVFFVNGFGITDTQEGRFTFDNVLDDDFQLDLLAYSFPIGDDLRATIFANAGRHSDYADTVNPFLEGNGGGQNALTRFSERNPIYRIGGSGAGVGLSYQPSNSFRIDAGYLSDTAQNLGPDQGLFNGNYSALAQIVVGDRFKVGLTYVHAYESRAQGINANRINFGGTGTSLANLNPIALFGVNALADVTETLRPVVSNSYGLEASLGISSDIYLNGWVGKTNARLIGLGDADIWNFAVGLALPDLLFDGSLGGLTFGAAPTLRSLDIPGDAPFLSRDFAYQLEGFYRYQVSDNISITPGLVWLPSPNQREENDDVFIGTIRTTFRF
jgi:hypothetical protein